MSEKLRPGYADAKALIVNGFDQNGIIGEGSTVPADNSVGYSPGGLFFKRAGLANAALYINIGTALLSQFIALGTTLLNGLLASAAELNRVAQLATREVASTVGLALTLALHDARTVTLNAAAGVAVTLPAATGTGAKLRIFIGTTITSNTTTITTAGADVYKGCALHENVSTNAVTGYASTANTIFTMNGSTQGGIAGDFIELEDVAAGVWAIKAVTTGAGAATPFS